MMVSKKNGAAFRPSAVLRASLFALAAVSLAGCTDRLATGSVVSDDHRVRHPIVLGERPVTISLTPGAKLDEVSKRRLAEFGAAAREEGTGRVEILIPVGAMNEAQARAALTQIRAALQESGVSTISVGSYPAASPRAQAPLRITYRAVRAAAAHRCGHWPVDLASGSSVNGWENQSYWNYGCAQQQMLAAQVDDARDLEAQRASTPTDIRLRNRVFDRVRQGSDPSTAWTTPNPAITTFGSK